MENGKLLIFSAPSGSGKTTIVKHLLKHNPQLGFSISACTRPKREKLEEHGRDYYFLSREEFIEKINNNEFVEYEEVYPGCYYGTLKSEINRLWNEGKHVVFDVDVKGGLNIKKQYGSRALAIFVKVPSMEILEKRLRERKSETEESIKARLYKVKFEMAFENKFDVTLINDSLEESLKEAQKIVDRFINS
ncbi:MAG: guanylate kinase [Cytophagaceae bacterium]|nr:guanylate kinase [Cytophagaceae bacterium]MDW8456116.1 guanylate kinase [Cytophagaceae bacterium]